MERYIVDRIEGDLAVCEVEDKTMRNIPVADLPDGATEGDCLVRDGETWAQDPTLKSARKARIDSLAAKLFED